MRMRTAVVVVPVLVVQLVACGQPVTEVRGRAVPVPVPVSTGAPRDAMLGDTPVAPETAVVKLQSNGSSVR